MMSAQCSELDQIRKVIDLYIDGVHNGNVESLRQAFHPQSSMYGYKGQDLYVTPIQGLYDYIGSNPSPSKTGESHVCSVTHIHVSGNAASVEMAMDSYHEHDFTDYFQMLKVDGRWWIVSKTFHANAKEK